jgi:peroxiredoxin
MHEPSPSAPQLAGPSSGRLLPSLELQHADGRPAPLWEYRGRGPLVVFLHAASGCAACAARLAELAAAHASYRELGAQVLAIGAALPYPATAAPALFDHGATTPDRTPAVSSLHGSPEHDTAPTSLPYPVLLDPRGRLADALAHAGVLPAAATPALLVVGRTGEIWAAWAGDHAVLPDAAEIMSWLEYALSECRECFCCELAWPEAWVRGEGVSS